MLLLKVLAALAALTLTAASPLDIPHYVHEKRAGPPKGWTKRNAMDRRAVLPMRIGLKQSNLDKTWEWLSDVSHPESENYGRHWSAKQVAEAFAPSGETVAAVRSWLSSAGIGQDRVNQSQGLNWLDFQATVDEAEQLLKTQYHVYEHETGKPHVACEEYSIPSHLAGHVDLVYPTVHFDAKVMPRDDARSHESKREAVTVSDKSPGAPGSSSLPKGGFSIDIAAGSLSDLGTCDQYITLDCLRALYQVPVNNVSDAANSLGIVEYTPQAYVPSDLDLFFTNYVPGAVGSRPILDSIDGGVVQQTSMSFDYNGESDLDLEYAMGLVYPQAVTLYQVGDLVEGASFNNFLDAIDASYCTYEGGDDPVMDGIYPDPYGGANAYEGPENCGGFTATKVISTSYGTNEHDFTPFYVQRQCDEYAKLGMMGVSVLYSSGDYGVAGNGGKCIDGAGADAPYNNGTDGRFNPSFPGTCPYVTSVGATQVKPGFTVTANMSATVEAEEACETVIYSGGGFSNVFPIPDYQSAAVKSYLTNYPPPYGSDRFNNTGTSRAFPDVSANGANYVVALDGQFYLVYGTSASSPTFASILTLINQERLCAGKSSVGFINPVAYAYPEVFNDITEGTNQGCGTQGFSSAPGWDPVTGLGTPNYPKMLELWLSLS